MASFWHRWVLGQPTLLASLTHDAVSLVIALVILTVGWWISTRMGALLTRALGRSHADPTLTPMLAGMGVWAVRALVVMAALAEVGVATASVLAVLGAAGLAIGLALQGTLQNIAAGIMLLVLRPFRTGDAIEGSGATSGVVREVGLFTTRLERGDGHAVFVPNSQIWSNPIVNYSQGGTRPVDLRVTLPGAADLGAVVQALRDWASSEPQILGGTTLAPVVRVQAHGSDGRTTLAILGWTQDPDPRLVQRTLAQRAQQRVDAMVHPRPSSTTPPEGGAA